MRFVVSELRVLLGGGTRRKWSAGVKAGRGLAYIREARGASNNLGASKRVGQINNAAMAWLHYLQDIYTLDTLDTRFTTSSRPSEKPLPSSALDGRVDPAQSNAWKRDVSQDTPPSRWRSAEFSVYYLIFLVAVPWMFKVTYDISKGH